MPNPGHLSLLSIGYSQRTRVIRQFADVFQLGRWIAVEVLNNLLDLAIIAFPIYFVRELQMSKAMKAKVVTGFGLRFPSDILQPSFTCKETLTTA